MDLGRFLQSQPRRELTEPLKGDMGIRSGYVGGIWGLGSKFLTGGCMGFGGLGRVM